MDGFEIATHLESEPSFAMKPYKNKVFMILSRDDTTLERSFTKEQATNIARRLLAYVDLMDV
jgi:hypothetical protein